MQLAMVSAIKAELTPTHERIVPLEPTELMKFLPETPKEWQLKESKARTFYNEWLVSEASRKFTQTPPNGAGGNAGPTSDTMTRVRLTDTGFNPALFADFDGFKPGRYGNTESLLVGTFPARRLMLPDGERLRILVRARFVFEIETHNQAPNAVILWAKLFDFSRLNSVPDGGITKLNNPVTVRSIDELNPKLNGSYQVSWSTQEDLDAARKRKP